MSEKWEGGREGGKEGGKEGNKVGWLCFHATAWCDREIDRGILWVSCVPML